MYELSSTWKIVTFCSADFTIRSNAKRLILEKFDKFVSKMLVLLLLLSHTKDNGEGGHTE